MLVQENVVIALGHVSNAFSRSMVEGVFTRRLDRDERARMVHTWRHGGRCMVKWRSNQLDTKVDRSARRGVCTYRRHVDRYDGRVYGL